MKMTSATFKHGDFTFDLTKGPLGCCNVRVSQGSFAIQNAVFNASTAEAAWNSVNRLIERHKLNPTRNYRRRYHALKTAMMEMSKL